MKTLLAGNKLWSDDASEYVKNLIFNINAHFRQFRSTMLPQPLRKVSLSSVNRPFNQVVCNDHMYLDHCCTVHATDTKTRFSIGAMCNDTSMDAAIYAFQTRWFALFWTHESIKGNVTFDYSIFRNCVSATGERIEFISPRRHQKNVLEPKHGMLRSVYQRLRSRPA